MTNLEKFKINVLNNIGPTFCAEKWLMADFHLHTGTTSSCHLPTPDKINFDDVSKDISKFNNTDEKLKQKQLMLLGQRPSKCSNCWYVEDANPSAISDRVIYSKVQYDIKPYNINDFTEKTLPNRISVAFDTLCNFTCSYCDPSQSSSWLSDLKINGIYKNILNDPRFTYQRSGSSDLVDDYEKSFQYFCNFLLHAKGTVKKIVILGGEPLMSPNFWRFLDFVKENNFTDIEVSIITNLSNDRLLKKFLQKTTDYKKTIAVSIENVGKKSEFVRKGLNWDQFLSNFKFLLNQHDVDITISSTISNLSIDGFVEFLEWFIDIDMQYKSRVKLQIYKVRHPNFQSLHVLPTDLKKFYNSSIIGWLDKNKNLIDERLINYIKNICVLLEQDVSEFEGVSITSLQNSAKSFYKEFANRHNLNISEIFSEPLSRWLNFKGNN